MKVTNIVNIDLSIRQNIPFVDAVQGDSARAIEFRLFDKGQPFNVPDGSAVLIRYKRPDGFGGVYDTLPNGEPAYSINANKVTAILSPTALGVPGEVDFQITISNGNFLISAFALQIRVDADPSFDSIDAEDYINISQFVSEEVKKKSPYIGENGNWWIGEEDTGVQAGGSPVTIDTTLSQEGQAADAKAVGDLFAKATEEINGAMQALAGAIPTEASINALIDAKLGVIENGTY